MADQEIFRASHTTQLCSMCRRIFDNWPAKYPKDKERIICNHHWTLLDLQISVDEGCTLCSQFRRCLDPQEWIDALAQFGTCPRNKRRTAQGRITIESDILGEALFLTLRFDSLAFDDKRNANYTNLNMRLSMNPKPVLRTFSAIPYV